MCLPYQVTARIGQQQLILGPDDFAWTGQRDAENFLHPGDIIYVHIVPSADSNLVLTCCAGAGFRRPGIADGGG